jgi:hypothetical protein
MKYKLHKNSDGVVDSVSTTTESGMYMSIPFSVGNTDYAEFKKAVTAGAELQDADGNVMTAEAAQAFVATLP